MEIPGPKVGIFNSQLAAYEADPIGFLTSCQKRYGDVFRLNDHLVVINDPTLIQRVLARTNRDSVPDIHLLDGGRSATTEETETWMRARELAMRVMKPPAVRSHLPQVNRALGESLHELSGSTFDPVDLTWEICLRATLPLCVPESELELLPALLTSSHESRRFMDAAVCIPRWWPSRRRRSIRIARQRVRGEILRLLSRDRVHQQRGTPPTLLDEILDQPDTIPITIADRALGSTLLSSIPAMGGAWCWLLYRLGTQPEALERIRAEATDVGLEALLQEPHQALPYTKAFVHEVLRTHPPAWLLGRNTTTSVALGDNAEVPVGTAVLFSPYLLHRDPRWWREPERFDPSRWLGASPPHAPHAYLPFGAGPRMCSGAYLGLMILILTAVHIATSYHLRTTALHPVPARYGSIMLPIGLSCRLTHDNAATAEGETRTA